jgi:hypothetical protein
MNPEEVKNLTKLMQEKDKERIPDDMNPNYLFNRTHVDLLVQIANGTLRTKRLALNELANRGLNHEGLWVGIEYER